MRGIRFWEIRQTLKAQWQRLWRIDGLANMDMWNVDLYLATKIAPVLRRFIKMERTPGIPSLLIDEDYTEEDDGLYVCLWEAILWKMLDGFERIISGDGLYIGRQEDYIEEALELFCEFYFCLWD